MKCPLAAILPLTVQLGFCQLAMPSWLVPYPGATAEIRNFQAYLEAGYATSASPGAVVDHYRKLFESANLPFQPNSDGIGTNIRGAAAECDLLISIRSQAAGTAVRVSCAEKSPQYNEAVTTTTSRPTPVRRAARTAQNPQPSSDEILTRHQQKVAELGIHRTYEDAPAPPLVWPAWLVDMNHTHPPLASGVDKSGHEFLRARYITSSPMTAIRALYTDLLRANGYTINSSSISTGHTVSGIQQNANGHVEGYTYPDGTPGPRTEIRVHFSRSHLNDPIEVDMRFTTFAFVAARRQF